MKFYIYFHVVLLLIFISNFRVQGLMCFIYFHERKSLFLIAHIILHNKTCCLKFWRSYRWYLVKWNKLYRRALINCIIYLYTHNTVQIHNNINIFNIGLIKTRRRGIEAWKGKNGSRWKIRKITTISRMKNENSEKLTYTCIRLYMCMYK